MSPVKKSARSLAPANQPIAVIGMGLMGHSIAACFLAADHPVVGVTRSLRAHRATPGRIRRLLQQMHREGLLKRDPARLIQSFRLTENIADIAPCVLIVESVIENLDVKTSLFAAIEQHVAPTAIIATNTSSIPISLLQQGSAHPARFVGIHWDEPAHITRFMEIVAGAQTSPRTIKNAKAIATRLGKEPSILRRDIRGFITNRVSYAMYREACNLVDSGVCTVEDIDRSLRNDVGKWMPFAGPFRYMDLMGVEAYYRVMKDLLPDLSTSPDIPPLMRKVIDSGGKGVSNGKGFYKYTPAEARQWQKNYAKYNYEIRRLTAKYPSTLKKQN